MKKPSTFVIKNNHQMNNYQPILSLNKGTKINLQNRVIPKKTAHTYLDPQNTQTPEHLDPQNTQTPGFTQTLITVRPQNTQTPRTVRPQITQTPRTLRPQNTQTPRTVRPQNTQTPRIQTPWDLVFLGFYNDDNAWWKWSNG